MSVAYIGRRTWAKTADLRRPTIYLAEGFVIEFRHTAIRHIDMCSGKRACDVQDTIFSELVKTMKVGFRCIYTNRTQLDTTSMIGSWRHSIPAQTTGL